MRWEIASLNLRMINHLGVQITLQVSNPNSATVLDVKRLLSKKGAYMPVDKLHLFVDMQRLEPDSKLLVDFPEIADEVAVLYAIDLLGRFKSLPSTPFNSERMVQTLFRFGNNFEADQIVPRLWLGNINAALNFTQLKLHNITHVLCVHHDLQPVYTQHFRYLNVKALDSPNQNLIQYFDAAIRFIHEAMQKGGTVLVHCHAGVSRSATFVLAYLMYSRNIQLQDALVLVQQQRQIADPNEGFCKQLQIFHEMQYNFMNKTAEHELFLQTLKN